MPKTMEELGLYEDQPDATVDSIVVDQANPAMAEVTFSDGRVATMPASHAEAMPQTDPLAANGQLPLLPEELAAAGEQGPPLPPGGVPAPAPSTGGATGSWAVNDALGSARPGAQVEDWARTENETVLPPTGGALPPPQVDPSGEMLAPASAGGAMAPFGESSEEGTQTTQTVDDPATMSGRVDDAYDQKARADRLLDEMRAQSQKDMLDLEIDERTAQNEKLADQLKQLEIERSEHERIYKAIEETPIDEDGFWNDSPGRVAGAYIALALSGFLQGVTRGANPAMNQMVQALNHAQDRYLQNQRATRDSKLRTREKLMGSADNAISSMKLQLSGMMEKKLQAEASREGVPLPPALSTYLAKEQVKRAEEKNAIGSRVAKTSSERVQAERRATPATPALFRGDVQLRELGVDRKAHADAMDPKGGNLGGVVGGADDMQKIAAALEKLQDKDGNLASQGTLSWTQLGLAPLAARLGVKNAEEQVNTRQLIEQAKLAFKQTINIKSVDSENEGRNFNAIMDSGDGTTTVNAVRQKAAEANRNAISIASGVSRNPQGYIDFIRQTQTSNPGVTKGAPLRTFRPMPGGGGAPRDAGDQVVEDAARPPLPPNAATSSIRTTGSPRGTYQRLRKSSP